MSDLVGNPEDRFSCVAAHLRLSVFNETCHEKMRFVDSDQISRRSN